MKKGETDLNTLLRQMEPRLNPGEYVYCTFPDSHLPIGLEPLAYFREAEGLSVIVTREQAEELALPYSSVYAWITLTVHSALEAVGLTAAFSAALTRAEISCNVVAAYYHDYLFVPYKDGERALEVLREIGASIG